MSLSKLKLVTNCMCEAGGETSSRPNHSHSETVHHAYHALQMTMFFSRLQYIYDAPFIHQTFCERCSKTSITEVAIVKDNEMPLGTFKCV